MLMVLPGDAYLIANTMCCLAMHISLLKQLIVINEASLVALLLYLPCLV